MLHLGEQSLVSKDQKSTYAVISLAGTEQEQQKAVERLRPQFRSDELQIQLGGPAAVNEEIKHQVESDLAKIEIFSFPILALLLLVVFRGFVAASLPLLLGGFSILGAFVITRLLTGVMEVSHYAINIITVLGLGLAVDYSLFMVSRFRESPRAVRSIPAPLSPRSATPAAPTSCLMFITTATRSQNRRRIW